MRRLLAALLLICAVAAPAAAQITPGRPIRIIVGFGPGIAQGLFAVAAVFLVLALLPRRPLPKAED